MKKRFFASLLTIAMVLSLVGGMTVFAAEATATVVADESWTNATYDSETQILTNVDGGYSFKWAGGASIAYNGTTPITTSKVVIPSSVNGVAITTLSSKPFGSGNTVEEVILSEGLKSISKPGFSGYTSLKKVKLPSTFTTIGQEVFKGCSGLTTINIPSGITKIDNYVFANCSALETIELPDSITSFGTGAFSTCGLTSMVVPVNVKSISKECFKACKNMTSITFKGNITTIGADAFRSAKALSEMIFEGNTEAAPTLTYANSRYPVNDHTIDLVVSYPASAASAFETDEFKAQWTSKTTFEKIPGVPVIADLTLTGVNVIENTLTTSYTYSDPFGNAESGSVAVWESCEEADFESSEVYFLKQQECSAANPPSYFIQETDDGKYIRVTVTPKHAGATMNVGDPVSVQLAEKVRFPQTVPMVELTSPGNGYMVNCNNAVTLSADVTLDNTTVTKVEFYANDAKVAEDATAPYEVVWTPAEMGNFDIYAKAYNALGEDGQSEKITVTVLSEDAVIDANITTVFTTPVAGARVLAGSAVEFTGTVVESSGSEIKTFELYANGKLLGNATLTATEATDEVTVPPYNFALSANLAPGTYEITSVAKSVDGKVGSGTAFSIEVSSMTFTKMISDNMVLQRNKPLKLSGYGVDGTTVTVELLGKSATTTVSGGKWQLTLPAMPTTKNTTIKFASSDGTEKTFTNIAIGEVIICSGQSNMTYNNKHGFSYNPLQEGIRLFRTSGGSATSPQYDTAGGTWLQPTTSDAIAFSGVGYLTGYYYYISQNGEVPVGLIQAAVSGTGINLWVPNDAFDYDPDLKRMDTSKTHYNHMIAPWTNYTVGHVLWYQGENDSPHSKNYEKALTKYVQTYRANFDDDLNFIVVMLPVYDAVKGYNSHTRQFWTVREGQWNITKHMDDVETAVTIDTGSIGSVHPGSKDKVGYKASLILQHFTNPSADLVWKSPNYASHEVVDGKMYINFNDVGAGLTTTDGEAPKAFMVAGDDMKFVNATATLVDSDTIAVDVSTVTGTPHVRYACEDVPNRVTVDGSDTWKINVVNSAGLPMAPFRTDTAKIQFGSYNETDGYINPLNFVPMIKGITASDIENGKSVVTVDARDFDDSVASVEVFVDGVSVGQAVQSTEDADTWTFDWTSATTGSHQFHAIATDVLGADSTRTSSTFSSVTTVTPQKFTYDLVNKKTDVTVVYDASNGAVANTTLDGVLIIAAYTDNDVLVKAVVAKNGAKTVSIPAADLSTAVEIKAFVFENLSSIKPLTTPAVTSK